MKAIKINNVAIVSSLVLTGLLLLFIILFGYSLLLEKPWLIIGLLVYSSLIHYFLFLYGINKSIYKRIKQIYKKIQNTERSNPPITSIQTIEKEVETWNKAKEKEIEKLKEREEFRREFIGNVSHELKTPIFTIQGYLLTVLDGALYEDQELSEKYIKRANKGVERMIHIVQDLEKITNLEAGVMNMDIKEHNVLDIAKNALENLEQKIARKKITVSFTREYPQKQMAFCDEQRIEQVFTNLLVNAIKYGKEEGKIDIDIFAKSEKIHIRIIDDGEGISSEHLPRLFERFYRVDKSRTRSKSKPGGSGLGLAIVKHILDAHKQSIHVESEIGKGTVFSFTLDRYEE